MGGGITVKYSCAAVDLTLVTTWQYKIRHREKSLLEPTSGQEACPINSPGSSFSIAVDGLVLYCLHFVVVRPYATAAQAAYHQPFAVQADADRYAADIYRKITMVTSPHPKFIRTPLIVVLVRWFVRNALNILAERRRTTRNDCSVNGAT